MLKNINIFKPLLIAIIVLGALAGCSSAGVDGVDGEDGEDVDRWAALGGRVSRGSIENDYTMDVGIDDSGTLAVIGHTDGTFAGEVSAGSRDLFLLRWTRDGAFGGVSQAGSSDTDLCFGVAVADDGTAYAVGTTYGDWDGTQQGSGDVLVVQWMPDGSIGWVDQYGTASHDRAYQAAFDSVGNLYVTGTTRGDLDQQTYSGNSSATFVSKYNTGGDRLWTRLLNPSDGSDLVRSIVVDDSGNPIVAGGTHGSLGGTNLGGTDSFIAKLTSSGSIAWINQFGSANNDFCNDLAIDASGRLMGVGYSAGDIFGGSSNGGDDAFVFHMVAEDGGAVDGILFGTAEDEELESVAIDPEGAILATGMTRGGLDPRLSQSIGGEDLLVLRVSDSLILDWVRQYGTRHYETGTGVVVIDERNIHISGHSSGPFAATTYQGQYDAVLLKLLPNGVFP